MANNGDILVYFGQKYHYFGFEDSVGWSISETPSRSSLATPTSDLKNPWRRATILDKIISFFEKRFGLFWLIPKHRTYLTLWTRVFVF
jgi:hypothetical protein